MAFLRNFSTKRVLSTISVLALLLLVLCAGSGFIMVKQREGYPGLIAAIDRDWLQRTDVARYYYKLAWHHAEEITEIGNYMTIPELLHITQLIDPWIQYFQSLVDGEGDTKIITADHVDDLLDMLGFFSARGSPALRHDIETELQRLNPSDFIGLSMTEAWNHLHEIWKGQDPLILSFLDNPDGWIPQPHGEMLSDDFYGEYWRVFRVQNPGFAFAYPADWTVYAMRSENNGAQKIKICNYDERIFTPDILLADIECIRVDVAAETDPSRSLEDAAKYSFCPDYSFIRCEILTHQEDLVAKPNSILLVYQRKDLSFLGRVMSVYRLPSGSLVNFSIDLQRYTSREYKAIITSFIPDGDGSIKSPKIIPEEPQPFSWSDRSRVELEITPLPTGTPWPTPYPLSEWTPQGTLTDGPYAEYWAEYRDQKDQYGFAYPADWTLRSQQDEYVEEKWMQVCNHNAEEYDPNNRLMICFFVFENQCDPSLSLEEAAYRLLDDNNYYIKALEFVPDRKADPPRVIIHYRFFSEYDPPEAIRETGYWIIFQNPNGKLIILGVFEREMTTAEIQAMINSFVFGLDTAIISPGFIPSPLVDFGP
ncbi:MAG: hypothetical protein JW929_16000 [Anaerolineales bacterium]|nr:hypothetical protein [Anaerolineales bacterium]